VRLPLHRLRRRHRQRHRLGSGQGRRAVDGAELRFGADVGEAAHHVAGAERDADQPDDGGGAGEPGCGCESSLGHLPESLQRWAVVRAGTTSTTPMSMTTALTTVLELVFMTRTTSPSAPLSRARPWAVSCMRSVCSCSVTRLFFATKTGVCRSVVRMMSCARIGRRGVMPTRLS